ncbi:hypothetical protein D3C71_787830 [compost metagenome]
MVTLGKVDKKVKSKSLIVTSAFNDLLTSFNTNSLTSSLKMTGIKMIAMSKNKRVYPVHLKSLRMKLFFFFGNFSFFDIER